MAAGSSQKLAFDVGADHGNTAVHGGGSCQLSLLYDVSKAKDPTAWKVIYSIEGGCPADTKGNLDSPIAGAYDCTSPDGKDCMRSYNYTIPQGVKSGNAILAWTWFNTIGNREMYMDCSNVNIQGGDGSEIDSLPPMYVANLASINTCKTPEESFAYIFPNAGKYTTKPANYYPLTTLPGNCGAGSGSGGSSPAQPTGSYGAPSASAAPSGSASAAPYQPAASLTTMVTASSPDATPASSAVAPSAAAPSAAAPYASGSTGSPNANVSSGSVPCQSDGSVVCIGSNQFGLCDHGSAVPQPLAAGTVCNAGVISRRSIVRSHARQMA